MIYFVPRRVGDRASWVACAICYKLHGRKTVPISHDPMHTRMFPPAPPEGYAEKCHPAVKTSERKRLPLFYEFLKEQKL